MHWSRSAHKSSTRCNHAERSRSGRAGAVPDPVEQVPVVVEDLGDRPQLRKRDAAGERDEDRLLQLRIFEQAVDEATPPRGERDAGRDLVANLDAGRQAGLDRELGQQPLRERVQGADRCRIEIVDRLRAALAHGHRLAGGASALLELAPDAVTQLGRGLVGEGDGRDGAHRQGSTRGPRLVRTVGRDELDDAPDQRLRLAGARAGLDEHRVVELGVDRGARAVVIRWTRVSGSSSVVTRPPARQA